MSDKKNLTKVISIIALLTAMEIVFSRFLSFNVWNMKIGFSFVPVMLAGYFCGPLGGAVVGGLADFLGATLFPIGAYFPGFTVTAALKGLVFGFLFFKKINFTKILIAVLSTQLVCGLILNTLFISVLYTKAFLPLLVSRIFQIVVLSAVEIIFAQFALKRFEPLKKIIFQNKGSRYVQ